MIMFKRHDSPFSISQPVCVPISKSCPSGTISAPACMPRPNTVVRVVFQFAAHQKASLKSSAVTLSEPSASISSFAKRCTYRFSCHDLSSHFSLDLATNSSHSEVRHHAKVNDLRHINRHSIRPAPRFPIWVPMWLV